MSKPRVCPPRIGKPRACPPRIGCFIDISNQKIAPKRFQ